MSRLRELNAMITGIDSEAKAIALVKQWLPNQAADIDKPTLGTQAGVMNCSLIAEFIVAFFSRGKVNYTKCIIGAPAQSKKKGTFDLMNYVANDPQPMVAELGGHNAAIIRDGNEYGLYQAWEGEFHVFPKLNGGDSHNIFGMGDDAVMLINNEIAHLESKCDAGQGVVVKLMA